MPPNGALLAAPVSCLFQLTMPARLSIRKSSKRCRESDSSPAARPYWVALASRTAASKSA
ncbi:hypothetical protein D3C80_2108220 [compost metagenome]